MFFLSENVQFLEVKISIYLNRRVFVMSDFICKSVPQHKSTSWFTEGIQNALSTIFPLTLPRRWQKWIDIGGEYFEKE